MRKSGRLIFSCMLRFRISSSSLIALNKEKRMIVEIFFDYRASLPSRVGCVQNRDCPLFYADRLWLFPYSGGRILFSTLRSGIFRGIEFGTRRLIQRPINPAQISVLNIRVGMPSFRKASRRRAASVDFPRAGSPIRTMY